MRSLVFLLLVLVAILSIAVPVLSIPGQDNADKAAKNLEAGKAWLESNKALPGVVVLPSGLQYKVLTSGTGSDTPTDSDQVSVHYAGRTIDGKEFDSSYARGQPTAFGVTQVIAGWTEILQLMVVGDVWEVYIPSDLAYGSKGAGGIIPPNSALIFNIELLEIPTHSDL
jgi:FKBP-type peptidyl-prolyl cis-trans isomerase FklB